MWATDAASHVGSSGSNKPGNEAAAVVVATNFDLLAGLADGLKLLLGFKANVDIALGQRGGGACVGVADHDIVVSVRRACAHASRGSAGAGSDTG